MMMKPKPVTTFQVLENINEGVHFQTRFTWESRLHNYIGRTEQREIQVSGSKDLSVRMVQTIRIEPDLI